MGKSAPPPQPPNVVQYPNVLTPPQDGGLETIESYQYSEVIELLSDGPIDGLVNKNGVNVNGVNLFEGVYFNDSPVKETSDLNYECFDMLSNCITSKLHESWSKSIPNQSSYIGVSSKDQSFNINYICIKTYDQATSLSYLDTNQTNQWLSNPLRSRYELFLTEICIPTTKILLKTSSIDLSIVDSMNSKNAIVFDIYDLSKELYPLISSDLFNSFSYFEMPKSSICYSSTSVIGSQVQINGINGNIVIKIWGTAQYSNLNLYPVYQKDVVDKYFNIFAYQNKESLYNFNSVQVEFKNGSQFQNSIESIKNIEVDYSINKSLIGPFDNSKPVQRLKSFLADSTRPPCTNVPLETEGSADNRYIKSWPVEYNYQNNPFLICDITMSYSSYDSTTANIKKQDAYPYTHHVLNQNVECVYITIALNQLSDTAHVDLAAVDLPGNKIGSTKYKNTELIPQGTDTYGQLDVGKKATYWYKNTNPGTAGNPGSLGGNLTPTEFPDLRLQLQSINVGSKLPAVVSFKVETGYESDIDGTKQSSDFLNTVKYYAYRYDIFGMVQTPNTNLDFGRSDLTYNSYVYSHKSNYLLDNTKKHLASYPAWETITDKYLNNYDNGERSPWYYLKYIKTTSQQSYYYDAITDSGSINYNQSETIKTNIRNTSEVTLYSAKATEFIIGLKLYTDPLLSIPFGNGIVYEKIGPRIEDEIFYEVKDSIITRSSAGSVNVAVNFKLGTLFRDYVAYELINPNGTISTSNIKSFFNFSVELNPTVSSNTIDANIIRGSNVRLYLNRGGNRIILSSSTFYVWERETYNVPGWYTDYITYIITNSDGYVTKTALVSYYHNF